MESTETRSRVACQARKTATSKQSRAWNAFEEKGLNAFALFFFALGLMTGLLLVNWWAEGKISLAADALEPRLITQTVLETCPTASLIDFASSPNGGLVLPAASSPSYHGLLLESISSFNQLALLISPDNSSESCWAFQGQHGFATIRLGRAVLPSRFALIHANLLNYRNAPRDFSVYSVRSEGRVLLGAYRFEFEIRQDAREMTQYFACRHHCSEPLSTVMLEIESNHGDKDVTCVYQFLVHGVPV